MKTSRLWFRAYTHIGAATVRERTCVRSISIICRIAAATFLIATSALAQPAGWFMSGSGDLQSGIVVRFRTMIEPPMSASEMKSFNGGLSGGVSDGAEAVHRFMWDNSIYFGYDIAVTRSAPANYSVTFLPLSISTERMLGRSLTPAPQPRFPAPQTVQDGDTIGLDLFVSTDGRHKIVDYIQILSPEKAEPPAASLKGLTPQDFTLDDGPVTFDAGPKITYWINGRKFEGSTGFTGKPGATLWVCFPGQPRYIISLVPSPGLEKAGAAINNVISFSADGQQYEIRFGGPVVAAGKAFNVYLARDPSYQRKPERANAVSAGVDRLTNLLPNR